MPAAVRKGSSSRTKTTTSKRRERSGELRREQILQTAGELFYRHGYRATSLNQIAQSFGLTGPALYYYFTSKERILFEIRDRIVREQVERVRALLSTDATPVEKLQRVLQEHLLTLLSNAAPNVVFERERGHLKPALERAIRSREREYESLLRALYRQGVKEGSFRDLPPQLAVGVLLASCNWMHRFNLEAHQLTPDRVAELLSELLASGYVVTA